jgi:hypothetical protein
MNKKSQILGLTTSLFLAALAIFIMIVLLISITLSSMLFTKPNESAVPVSKARTLYESLPIKQITVRLSDGSSSKMSVLEASILWYKGMKAWTAANRQIDQYAFEESLKPLLTTENNCLFINDAPVTPTTGSQNVRIGLKLIDGKIIQDYYFVSTKHSPSIIDNRKVLIGNQEQTLSFYYGGCLP